MCNDIIIVKPCSYPLSPMHIHASFDLCTPYLGRELVHVVWNRATVSGGQVDSHFHTYSVCLVLKFFHVQVVCVNHYTCTCVSGVTDLEHPPDSR